MRTLVKDQAALKKPCQPVTLKKGLEIGRELFKFFTTMEQNLFT
jgi:hypothetical protein